MDRRGFLGSILLAAVAPAIVRADSLMRILPTETLVAVNTAPGVITVMPRADALWVGAIREMCGYDISRDALLWRWDVVGRGKGGALEQLHVMASAPTDGQTERAREPALAVLRDHIKHHGLTPIRGVLTLPDGMREARFL